MKIHLRLFAGVREKVGKNDLTIELPEGTQVKDLEKFFLGHGLEEVGRYMLYSRIAVNLEFSGPETCLKEGDEVALIPPVAGG